MVPAGKVEGAEISMGQVQFFIKFDRSVITRVSAVEVSGVEGCEPLFEQFSRAISP